MKLALSTLRENPSSKTGLTTFFREFVERSLDAEKSVCSHRLKRRIM